MDKSISRRRKKSTSSTWDVSANPKCSTFLISAVVKSIISSIPFLPPQYPYIPGIPQHTISPFLYAPHNPHLIVTNTTLRQYLTHQDGFHMGMAPAFFGFYAYFGALITLDEELQLLPSSVDSSNLLKSVAGASAGAMAASLIAVGLKPRVVAQYVSALNFASFADPPGVMGFLRGDKFESMLRKYLKNNHRIESRKGVSNVGVEDALIPLAVTGYDLRTMKGHVFTKGDLAQATRASATFPGLFQPVYVWENSTQPFSLPSSILIDGGISDPYGLAGLFSHEVMPTRIVNLSVGAHSLNPLEAPPGPSDLGEGVKSVVSISLRNTPKCGPWAMENGPIAVEAARKAILEVLDLPMYQGNEKEHYEVHIDVSPFY